MPISLSRLCENTEKSYQLRLIAGRDGLDNPVRWVHMIEDPEVTGFIHGNELVFTTGIRQRGVDWLLDFVVNLREHGAVGLVVNLGPYITSIPPQVIVYCEQNAFPLFTIPWEEHIIDVTYDFCHRIVSSEEIETSVAAAFRNLIFSPEKEDGYRTAMLRSGFHNESSYTIMALRLKTTRKIRKLSDLWKQYSFSMGRILKKSAYPACVFQQENNLILVRQKSSPAEMKRLYTAIQRLLDKQDSLFAGISTVEEGWGKVPELYSEAVSALTVACQRRVPCMEYADLGIYKVLFGVRDTSILSDYVKSTLGVLMEYDRKNNTDYIQTLRVYLDSNGSVQQVAQKLNFLRNTVNYKMKMIREILQTELRDTDKMNYMLAFCIMEMLGAV